MWAGNQRWQPTAGQSRLWRREYSTCKGNSQLRLSVFGSNIGNLCGCLICCTRTCSRIVRGLSASHTRGCKNSADFPLWLFIYQHFQSHNCLFLCHQRKPTGISAHLWRTSPLIASVADPPTNHRNPRNLACHPHFSDCPIPPRPFYGLEGSPNGAGHTRYGIS